MNKEKKPTLQPSDYETNAEWLNAEYGTSTEMCPYVQIEKSEEI